MLRLVASLKKMKQTVLYNIESVMALYIRTIQNSLILGETQTGDAVNLISNAPGSGNTNCNYSSVILNGRYIDYIYQGTTSPYAPERSNSIIQGSEIQLGKRVYNSIISGTYIKIPYLQTGNSLICGDRLKFEQNDENSKISGTAVVGKYNEGTYTDDQRFIVGAGTSEQDRRDCFKTGYDGTDSYITVGSTKVTESQLIQLLGLLNPSTT